ncbi:MAG: hypothetical protein M1296_04185, partial [Chloroflexi bacterium]|nr:hypothetical protein [Chloroflexota bacterium]
MMSPHSEPSRLCLVLIVLVGPLIAALLTVAPAWAANSPSTVPVLSLTEEKLSSTVTKTVIVTSFATSHDLVEVYNYQPVAQSTDWHKATEMDDSTWVFRPGGGPPKLAIFFTVKDGKHIAELYDDQFGEGAAPVALHNDHVVLTHPIHWTMRAESLTSWYLPGGRIADQLYFEGAFSLPYEADANSVLAQHWRGHAAWDYTLYDPTGSGIPEYGLLRLFPFVAGLANTPRTDLILNVEHYRIEPFHNVVFWPYLSPQFMHLRTWFDRTPPISMNWQDGRLVELSSFLPNSEPENGEQIFSAYPFHLHSPNQADFENPFAYYRFDPGNTGFPNLIIRNYYFPKGDLYQQYGGTPSPVEFVRYSWGNGNGRLLYKIGLLGRYPAQDEVKVGSTTIASMDYATFPKWIMAHIWDFVTFVASEDGGFRSSEGIYAWDQSGRMFDYAYNYRNTAPVDQYQSIAPGFRGELSPSVTGVVKLYVSHIDGRLHYLGATMGVWNVDGDQVIRTGTLDGQHIGIWKRSVHGREVEALYHVPGMLLYAAQGRVVLQQVALHSNSGPIDPPTDETSLNALRAQLPSQVPDIAGEGLDAMLNPASPQITLEGASLRDVHILQNGWRAELLPSPNVTLRAATSFPKGALQALISEFRCGAPRLVLNTMVYDCTALSDQPLAVSFNGAWHAQSLTPANVHLTSLTVGRRQATGAYAEQSVSLTVAN